jgi:predicted amidohydrolase
METESIKLTIDLWTFDVGVNAPTLEAYAAEMTRRVYESWDSGADVVVFPEYAWMGLERWVTRQEKLAGVAELFWNGLWPGLQKDLNREGKVVVLGSVPWMAIGMEPAGAAESTVKLKPGLQRFHNRVPIVCSGRVLFQDKLHLTPWESVFSAGTELQLFMVRGVTFAVIICLDIEVPELSAALRDKGVGCLLVPSATENILGVERVGRCANARSVELCCHVGVSQLVGCAESELVDENVGRLGWFTPSQTPFLKMEREQVSEVHEKGFHKMRCVLDAKALARARSRKAETNPAQLVLRKELHYDIRIS